MAGDWIKMEVATPDKPEVLAITARMGWDDPDLAVGKLFRVWRWFDQHTTDGNAHSVTLALLDRIAGVTGFGAAMQFSGWLIVSDTGISLPNFDRHCGKTAKERAQTAKRVASHKSNAKANAQGNADTVTNTVTDALPREEKRREEKEEKQEIGESPVGDPPSPAEPKAKKPKREKRPDLTFDQWLATIPDDADIVPADDPLWSWWETQRLPFEWRPLAWAAFEQKYTGKPKRYADWLAVFRQAVREDWLHVWRSLPDGSNVLTTVGEQLRRAA